MHCLAFSEPTIQWFRSYLTNRLLSVNVGNEFSSPDKLSCEVPQGSVVSPLLFLLYVNNMPQAVSCEPLLYEDDTYLICTGKDIKTIKDQLNKDFNSIFEWFIDNKLSIHFGKEKTKSVLFGTIYRKFSSNAKLTTTIEQSKTISRLSKCIPIPK